MYKIMDHQYGENGERNQSILPEYCNSTLTTQAYKINITIVCVRIDNCSVIRESLSTKVCSLLEWSSIISIAVSSDHSQLRCTDFAGSH